MLELLEAVREDRVLATEMYLVWCVGFLVGFGSVVLNVVAIVSNVVTVIINCIKRRKN